MTTVNLSCGIVRLMNTPQLFEEFVKETGLSRRFVATELRRAIKFLNRDPVWGRQSISHRVFAVLMAWNRVIYSSQDEFSRWITPLGIPPAMLTSKLAEGTERSSFEEVRWELLNCDFATGLKALEDFNAEVIAALVSIRDKTRNADH